MKTTSSAVVKRHVLPGERGGDVAWFRRQNSFERQDIFHQVTLGRRRRSDPPDGHTSLNSALTHSYILAAGHEWLSFQRTRNWVVSLLSVVDSLPPSLRPRSSRIARSGGSAAGS